MTAAHPKPIGTLLADTFRFSFRSHAKAVILGILFFILFFVAFMGVMFVTIFPIMWEMEEEIAALSTIPNSEYRVEIGEDGLPLYDKEYPPSRDEIEMMYLKKMVPYYAAMMVPSIFFGVIFYLYIVIMVVQEEKRFFKIVSQIPRYIIPEFALSILLAIIAYAPFFLVVLAIYMEQPALMALLVVLTYAYVLLFVAPRFMISFILPVKEGAGPMQSLKRSYDYSRGHWGKIMGNLIVWYAVMMGIYMCFVIIAMILGLPAIFIAVSTESLFTPILLGSIVVILYLLFLGYISFLTYIFIVKLCVTIVEGGKISSMRNKIA